MASNFPHITIDPQISAGRPCVAETGVKVTEVAAALEAGRSVYDLQGFFKSRPLTLGEIYSALAYYQDNKDELARVQADDQRIVDETEKARLEKIKRYYLGLP
jgi:uncharacterized protein (DUF433 family)